MSKKKAKAAKRAKRIKKQKNVQRNSAPRRAYRMRRVDLSELPEGFVIAQVIEGTANDAA